MLPVCPLCAKSEGKVELAACKHMICSGCFYEHQGKSSSVCPVCTIEMSEDNTSENLYSASDDSPGSQHDDSVRRDGQSDCVYVHGYRSKTENWQYIVNKRLSDMLLRYEIYHELFANSKSLFIHVPKTAGTSLEDALFNIRNRSQHAPLSFWRKRFSSSDWKSMFKFAIVRHPFHRLISGYTYWKNGALAGQKVDQPFVHRCRAELDTLPKFVNYLIEINDKNLWDCRDLQGFDGTCPVQFRPQLWFLSDHLDDSLSMHVEQSKDHVSTAMQVENTVDEGVGCSEVQQPITSCRISNANVAKLSNQDDSIMQPDTNSSTSIQGSVIDREMCCLCPLRTEGSCGKITSQHVNKISLDYIGRYEDLEDVYSVITQAIDFNNDLPDLDAVRNTDSTVLNTLCSVELDSAVAVGMGIDVCANKGRRMWPSLPHKRASLHSRDLPECFQDPGFVKAVLTVYQCDFDAFGYSYD